MKASGLTAWEADQVPEEGNQETTETVYLSVFSFLEVPAQLGVELSTGQDQVSQHSSKQFASNALKMPGVSKGTATTTNAVCTRPSS